MSENIKLNGPAEADTVSPEQWRALYWQLVAERDLLKNDLEKVRKERDDYLKAVHALLPRSPVEFTKDELFSQQGAEPTVEQLLAEIKESISRA
jgi:hypothetical protein